MKAITVSRLRYKGSKILLSGRKKLYQTLLVNGLPRSILFIVGCQRSGTSIMQIVFRHDLNTTSFEEFSELSSNDHKSRIRLNSLDLVEKEFSKVKAPFIVIKPLVESQNILQLLDYFHNSKAVWMFRNYRAVALSNINYFGINNGIEDLRPIVRHEPQNWRSEKVSRHVHETISKYFSEDMNPHDAAVLFWFARNSLYFDLELHKDPRVLLCSYEDFVLEPEKNVKNIYRHVGQVYPKKNMTAAVHSKSRKNGQDIELSPEIENLAQELQDRLEVAYRAQSVPF
jgi:hypothetical protein